MVKITITLSKETDRKLFELICDKRFAFICTLDGNPFIKDCMLALSDVMLGKNREQPISLKDAIGMHMAILAAEVLYGKDSIFQEDKICEIMSVFESLNDTEEVQNYFRAMPGILTGAMKELYFGEDEYWRINLFKNIIGEFFEKPEELF